MYENEKYSVYLVNSLIIPEGNNVVPYMQRELSAVTIRQVLLVNCSLMGPYLFNKQTCLKSLMALFCSFINKGLFFIV